MMLNITQVKVLKVTFLQQQETVSCGDLSIPEKETCMFQTHSTKLFFQKLLLILQLLQLIPPTFDAICRP